MTRLSLVLGVALFVACDSSDSVLVLPNADNVQSVLMYVQCGSELEVSASTYPITSLSLECRDGLALTFFYYRESLEDLGLAPGPVPTLEQEPCEPLELPAPESIYEGGSASESFVQVERASEAVRGTVLRGVCPCGHFEITHVPTDFGLVGAVPDGPRSVLVGTTRAADDDIRFFQITETDTALVATTTIGPARMSDMFRGNDGQLWIAAKSGRLWHGTPSTGFAPTESVNQLGVTELILIDGARGSAPFELFVISTGEPAAFVRFDGTDWTLLAQPQVIPDLVANQGQNVQWIGPGRAMATVDDSNVLLRYDDGNVTTEAWDKPNPGPIRGLQHLGGGRVLLTTQSGRFFESSAAGWDELPPPEPLLLSDYLAIAPFEDGFIAGSRDGDLLQRRQDFGFCPVIPLMEDVEMLFAVPLEDGAFLVGQNGFDNSWHGFFVLKAEK